MKRLENTTREHVKVKYYFTKRKGKVSIKAQLSDDHGVNIDGAYAQYTLAPVDTEEDGKIAARTKALQKMDEMFKQQKQTNRTEEKDYFRTRWNALTQKEQKSCIAEYHKQSKTQKAAMCYFENNILPRIDQYGPDIDEDQAKAVVNDLYIDMLGKKKYQKFYVPQDGAQCVESFFLDLINTLRNNQGALKRLCGHRVDMTDVESLLKEVMSHVLKEDRLRSLMEYWLQDQESRVAVRHYCRCVEADSVLLDMLSQKDKRDQAVEKMILILRSLSGNERQTKGQVNTHVRDANCILRNLCVCYTKEVLPIVILPEFIIDKAPQMELCKELPWAVRVYFTASCMSQARSNSYACGGIVMMTAGPRVAEVCAIQFGDILDMGDWGVCVINYTADGDIRKDDGKNIYFRRPIFLVKIAMDIIHIRKEELRKQGYSDEQIAKAYLVSRPDDYFTPARTHSFSSAIKAMLEDAGCEDNYWAAIEQAMIHEPDLDYFSRPEKYAAAYALRRDATSMMCNVAKMDPLLVDAILGHRLPPHMDEWSDKIKRDDEWSSIIAQMERVVYDPDHSVNPAFAVTELGKPVKDADKRFAIEYQGYLLSASRDCRATVVIRTIGNADVKYSIPASVRQNVSTTALVGTNRPYCSLSPLPSREDYDKIKKAALNDVGANTKKSLNSKEKKDDKHGTKET